MTESPTFTSTLTPDRAVLLLWSRWRLLALIGAVFGGLGVIYALLLAPVEYESGASLMPEFEAGSAVNLKRFGALADLVGIDIDGATTTEAVRPDLYPDILSSTPFLLDVLNHPVVITRKKTYPTLTAYLTTEPSIPLMSWLTPQLLSMPRAARAGHPVRLNREQEDFMKDFRKRIVADLDKQSGLILIQVKMPDAEVAAQVCQQAITYLTDYVVHYRTDKTRKDLTFLTKQLSEAKTRYNRALRELSAHSDQNRFLYMQSAHIETKRLQAEHDLSQSLYADLSHQYEQTRLKFQEETPILSVLEPPKVPARRSEPRRALTVLVFVGVGFLSGIGWLFGKALWLLYNNDKSGDDPKRLHRDTLKVLTSSNL